MGNAAAYRQISAAANADQDLRNFMQQDLPKFVLQTRLGNGKFMKSYIMRVDSTQLVVKVYMKPGEEDLTLAAQQLTYLWRTLPPSKYPSLLPYQMWLKSASASLSRNKSLPSPVYLLRQYFYSNLNDRLSIRPFLDEIEKHWIIFQLFKCLEICHEHQVVHGDIKPENVLCTTSNWIVLTDFSPFKPALLPEDDPTMFQYYFDPLNRHRCYVAPERFSNKIRSSVKTSRGPGNETNKLSAAVDVFSLGCVIAEILLDGNVLLDLPAMLQYISSPQEALAPASSAENTSVPAKIDVEDSPAKQLIARIKNPLMRQVVVDMTQKDPSRRLSASEYLKVLTGRSAASSELAPPSRFPLPSYFETSLYPLYLKLHWNGVTPDDRVKILCESFNEWLEAITGLSDAEGAAFFALSVEQSSRLLSSVFSLEPKASLLLLPAVAQHLRCADKHSSFLQTSNERAQLAEKTKVRSSACAALQEIHSAQSNAHEKQREYASKSGRELVEIVRAKQRELEAFLRDEEEIVTHTEEDQKSKEEEGDAPTPLQHVQRQSFFAIDWDESKERPHYEGLVLIVDLLCANYRHLKLLSSRILCLSLLARIGRLCSDAVILQRIVPLFLCGLEDSSAAVRVLAIRAIAALTSLVRSLEPIELQYFPQYVFPAMTRLCKDNELAVRLTLAECIGTIALTAKRFVDIGTARAVTNSSAEKELESNGGNNNMNNNVDETENSQVNREHRLEQLREQVSRWIRDLISDSLHMHAHTHVHNPLDQRKMRTNSSLESSVKKVLLKHTADLCEFFGAESAVDKLLMQLLTFLNEQDWELRCLFCQYMPTIGAFLGASATSVYIVPCLENSVYDVEERVSLATIVSMTSLVQLRLVTPSLAMEFVEKSRALLLHPAHHVRRAVLALVLATSSCLGPVGTSVFLLPRLHDLLRYELAADCEKENALSEEKLWNALAGPVSPLLYQEELLRHLDDLLGNNNNGNNANNKNSSFTSARTVSAADIFSVAVRRAPSSALALSPTPAVASPPASSPSASPIMSRTAPPVSSVCVSVPVSVSVADDLSDERKLQLLAPFLRVAAGEIHSKVQRWKALHAHTHAHARASVVGGNIRDSSRPPLGGASTRASVRENTPLSPAHALALSASPSGRYSRRDKEIGRDPTQTTERERERERERDRERLADYALNWTTSSSLAPALSNALHTMPVPLSRSAAFVSEELRRQSVFLDEDEARNLLKIQALFLGPSIAFAARERERESRQGFVSIAAAEALEDLESANSPAGSTPSNTNSNVNAAATLLSTEKDAERDRDTSVRQSSYTSTLNSVAILKRLRALRVPPLPVDLGALLSVDERDRERDDAGLAASVSGATMLSGVAEGGAPSAATTTGVSGSGVRDSAALERERDRERERAAMASSTAAHNASGSRSSSWRPREHALVCTLREHTTNVTRLAVSPDQLLVASASTDHTVRLWPARTLAKERVAFTRSVATYRGHNEAVLDCCVIENSHSFASSSRDGAVHVWRADLVSTNAQNTAGATNSNQDMSANSALPYSSGNVCSTHSVSGTTQIRQISAEREGSVVCVQHYHSDVSSVVVFATQRGGLHGWDLRTPREAFSLPLRAELGACTSMTIAPDRHWIATGHAQGFVSLYDVRFNTLSALWRHSSQSSITRLACCKAIKYNYQTGIHVPGLPSTEGAYLFVASEENEASVFGLPEGGECFKCFRTLSLDETKRAIAPLPVLQPVDIPRHALLPVQVAHKNSPSAATLSPVRAMLGRISPSHASYLLTAGADQQIRFWDFRSAEQCYTVAGLLPAQSKSVFVARKIDDRPAGQLFVCYASATPSTDKILQAQLPLREGRGLTPPNVQCRAAITDLKELDLPGSKLLLSSSADGEIQVWR